MKNLIITICARGGSKGIPKKNIRDLNGKSLISYTIEHARLLKQWIENNFQINVFIALSTDDILIKNAAEKYGLKTEYIRPDSLANDTAGKLDVMKDILVYSETKNKVTYDYLLDMDVSAPMRTQEDLQKGFQLFLEDSTTENLFSVSNAHKNPYFNMVEQNAEGFYSLSKNSGVVLSRQKAPKVYEMNASFYYFKRSFFEKEKLYLFDRALIYKMDHISFDLDEIVDFEFLEFLITNNKLPFSI